MKPPQPPKSDWVPETELPPRSSAALAGIAAFTIDAIGTVTPPLPPILVSTTVEVFGVHLEGNIVHLVKPAWRALLKLLEEDPDARFKIPPRKLEEIVAASYDADGYDEVILTPQSGDGGRDVIAGLLRPNEPFYGSIVARGRSRI